MNLGAPYLEIPIETVAEAFESTLRDVASGGLAGLAAENLQARIRGTMLMALSNTYGWLVVSTGNKSELAVGYSTLYGDMVGGFALLKDVFKTDVWRLSRYLNERADTELIPESTIDREPSAELREDQRDEDSLPPYLRARPGARGVRRARPFARRAARAVPAQTSSSVPWRSSTAPSTSAARRRPGVKLRPKAFGRDWRPPITNRWQS